jgi:hypothetical protein
MATTNIKGAKIVKANFRTDAELVAAASATATRIDSMSTALAGPNSAAVPVPEDGTWEYRYYHLAKLGVAQTDRQRAVERNALTPHADARLAAPGCEKCALYLGTDGK